MDRSASEVSLVTWRRIFYGLLKSLDEVSTHIFRSIAVRNPNSL